MSTSIQRKAATALIHKYLRRLTMQQIDSEEDAAMLYNIVNAHIIVLSNDDLKEVKSELHSVVEIAHDHHHSGDASAESEARLKLVKRLRNLF